MRITESAYHTGCQEVKEHGGRDFPFNIYPCSIPVDFKHVPVHWHEEMEIISVKKGKGIVTVDRKPFRVEEGELMIIFPGQLHGISRQKGEKMEYENIIFRPSLLMAAGEDLCTAQFLQPLTREIMTEPLYVSRGEALYPAFDDCIKKLDAISGSREYGYQMAVKGILFQILFLVLKASGLEPSPGSRKSREKMKQLLEYVEEHFGERITIEDAAAICYYSKSHFMKYFKQYMGMSFISYLNDYRLSRAAAELLSSDDGITAVAERCGFDNLSYFNRLFRRRYGMTPGEYRKNAERVHCLEPSSKI